MADEPRGDVLHASHPKVIDFRRSTQATRAPRDLRCRRLLDAMAQVVGDEGFAAASVSAVCGRAKLSRQAFYGHFTSREECFLAVLDDAYEQAIGIIVRAFRASTDWRQGLREALASLLALFESRPGLARLWIIEAIAAGPWALAHRERNVVALAEAIFSYWQPTIGAEPKAALNAMTFVLGTIQRHLAIDGPESPITLLGPLVGIATSPFLDDNAVAVEVHRADELSLQIAAGTHQPAGLPVQDSFEIPHRLLDSRSHRARACLLHLAALPGASNRQIADAIGVPSATQISVLLARLVDWTLVEKQTGGPGRPNANSLTAKGNAVARAIASEYGDPNLYTSR